MFVVGVDEVGRGCWAGPLLAAAVVLHERLGPISGLTDSKQLSARQRQNLDVQIRDHALAIGVGWVWPAEIDKFGLSQAVRSAMTQAMQQVTSQLAPGTQLDIIIDGSYNFLPQYEKVTTIVRADGLIPSVSAASIIAKVARDSYMQTVVHTAYPDYGFDKHVGYGTPQHIGALKSKGVTDIHRRSFKPISRLLSDNREHKHVDDYS